VSGKAISVRVRRERKEEEAMSIYDIDVTTIDGQPHKMEAYRGKTLLVVNVASHCGYTPQYAGLQALYDQYKDKGFAVLGFPCNQFGRQEPGNAGEIQRFCSSTYHVTFPLFTKVSVNGTDAHPLFQHLKTEQKGPRGEEGIQWNFTKFLVGPDGAVLKRYESADTPARIGAELAALLQ
jgi:glutathione peroxidase